MNWSEFLVERRRRRRPFVVAHRGVRRQAPENTVRSFLLALEQGAFALETDLHFTADDEIVLMHDPTLERTTDGHGLVRNHSLRALKQLRTRLPQSNQPGEHPIPTLLELIQATNAQTPLLLELKDPLFQDRRYARRLIDTLRACDMLERTAVVSFAPAHVAAVKTLCPEIPAGYITLTNPMPPAGVELLGPAWPLLRLNPLYVAWAHRRNSVVCPLDVTPERRMRFYLRLQVDAVLADEPAAALAAMG
jgi:glycerophosphoryl diester phosphodiesterase